MLFRWPFQSKPKQHRQKADKNQLKLKQHQKKTKHKTKEPTHTDVSNNIYQIALAPANDRAWSYIYIYIYIYLERERESYNLITSKSHSTGHLGALLPPEPGTTENEPQDHLGPFSLPEPGTPQNKLPEAIWEAFCYQSREQLKMSLQRPSGSFFVTGAWNNSK